MDRGHQCGHFAPRTLSNSQFILFRVFTYVVFHICSVFFDFTGTFQVQPLSGKGWWYAYNFDWYPKCPKWSTLSRNVSVFVFPVPVFRPHHPSLGRSLQKPQGQPWAGPWGPNWGAWNIFIMQINISQHFRTQNTQIHTSNSRDVIFLEKENPTRQHRHGRPS